ncbi:AraC family transcriptional regulator [Pollutimonas harenae]|uniref:AraC family transcriptional regulator ligand-binding domain-containing protein n=1 Tax=Pollutimonas harenae TaxID=657015 RepID=A0A853GVL6_9BURK|nr:AraC family transcriptional regulator [Pollutimonas harenae]NYT86361.1 AraC family transcriptional regulator ligand-binding domain-containing protein [Pollutimonas harenae]TEA69881.1 AraC family transcriptional regulator [Pollutimonas harenae]
MSRAIDQQVFTSTVSVELLRDLLLALQGICDEARLRGFLAEAGIFPELVARKHARITHEQLVRFYQIAAGETGDEMMGLWSRPIRTGALKVICRSVRDASSVAVALYRFTQVWNLMLDDYQLVLTPEAGSFGVSLLPRHAGSEVNRFGHMLMLKLAHGVVSWLVGHEVPLRHVRFTFSRPDFAEDYRVLFPAEVEYEAPCSTIHFHCELAERRFERPYADLRPFLLRAPRDWIFTTYKEHTLSMKVRGFLSNASRGNPSLKETAQAFHISPRTLIRRLAAEHTSFQGIKDALRRDVAIFELINTNKSLDSIADDHGFASVSIFHRAFKRWTGNTPGEYRRSSVFNRSDL